jgi:DNA-binding NarL/FixJ family response regulator
MARYRPTVIVADPPPVPIGRTRVLVVDDHRPFAELLARALEAESDFECVGHAQDSAQALVAVERLNPDVVLMDVHLPDRDGICTTADLVRDHADLKILILTAHASLADVERAATAGASGFLAKDGSLLELLDGLRTARRGSLVLPDGLVARLTAADEIDRTMREWHLPPREMEVLRRLGDGRDPRGSAKELGVSLHTFRRYVKAVLAKLGSTAKGRPWSQQPGWARSSWAADAPGRRTQKQSAPPPCQRSHVPSHAAAGLVSRRVSR